jgi:UDP-N-acetylmuramate dehydrogenase
MKNYLFVAEEFKAIVVEDNVLLNEPMCNHVSFKVGGPVDILVLPRNYTDVQELIKICNKHNTPYYIMGNGSNLLVKDGGIRGVVIKLSPLNIIEVTDNKIVAQSGALLSDVSDAALNNSLTGFEFACGIPGCVGGAVSMNAGAYIGEIKDVIESTLVLDKEGNIKRLAAEELKLSYRNSVILMEGYVVLEATFKLKVGDYDAIKSKIDELQFRRKDKQPLEYPSAGSTFKRPVGHFAGKLIEDSNLKGVSIGGAQVSAKHSGFIINAGNATAKDILALIKHVQNTVHEKFGVELHTEVRIVGED